MNKRKLLTLALSLSMLAILAVGATLAYFTDTDDAENVFTVGSVDIKLLESTLHRDNDGATNQQIIDDAEKYDEYLAKNGQNMVPGRWVRKAPYIQNVGKNDAFVRIRMDVPAAMMEKFSVMLYTTAQNKGEIVMSDGVTENGITTYYFTYTKALAAPAEGATSVTYYAPFWQLKIDDELDNADLKDVSTTIKVTAEAIQAEGFADYVAAFAAYDTQK